jgi:hypothetical protein
LLVCSTDMPDVRITGRLALALLAGCTAHEPIRPAPAASPVPAGVEAPACPTPATGAITLDQLQGPWRVRSSTGQPGAGHVFHELLGETLTIAGDRLYLEEDAFDARGRPIKSPITKQIQLIPCTAPQALELEQTHDAKGWSRTGALELVGDVLTLSLNFPQEPPPTDLLPADDGREVVVLERS